MEMKKIEYAFKGVWARFKNSDQHAIDLNQVKNWAEAKGLLVKKIERKRIGAFQAIDSVVIQTEGRELCLPISTQDSDESWEKRNIHYNNIAEAWKKLEWFSPLWISRNDVNKLLEGARVDSADEAIQNFNFHASTIYTLSFEATCIEQVMGSAPCLVEIQPLAREAYLAFYAGYKSASIAALIPAIEGAITRILPSEMQDFPVMEKVNKVIEGAISYAAEQHYDNMWTPTEYKSTNYLLCIDERIFAFETFRLWLKESFFRNTNEYQGAAQLNRHLFAHGLSPEWQQASLSRLIVAISTIGVIESWYRKGGSASLFFPKPNKDSELLWEQAILHGSAQMVIKLMEENNYHKHGKRVPAVPTDDGVLLRKALLNEECVNELVRPLRDAGWSVEFIDNSSDLFIKLRAKSTREEFLIALLYSCGTDNSLYKELEKDCIAILYRGTPYLQEQFAKGVKVHVGPVTAWQPPKACN